VVKPAKTFFAIAFIALLAPPAHAQHCPVPAAAGRAVVDPDAPLQLRAGRMVSEDRDTVTLHGDAELRQGPRKFNADHITYNREKREVNAAGGVTVRNAAGDVLRADEARVELHNFTGEAAAVDYAAGGGTGRGRASRAELRGRGVLVLEDAAYTQCPPGNDDVVLTAAQITLHSESGFGVAKHAKLRFKNVPVFYLPRLSFPISDRRKSGFLFPSAGYDGDSGLVVEAPLYLNLHPSADATVTPAVHTGRGAQLALEARYLVPGGGGELHGAGLPNDDALQQRDRWAVDYRHRHRFTDHLQGALDYRDVSDNFYLGDFADGIAASSATTLPASAELKYDDGRWRARAGAAAYTVVDNNVAAADFPYDKLPYIQLSGHGGTTLGALRAEYGVHTSLVHFKRGHGTEGRRLRARPTLHFPLRGRGGFLIPALSLDYTRYHIDGGGDGSGQTLSRTVPLSVWTALWFLSAAPGVLCTHLSRVFFMCWQKIKRRTACRCLTHQRCAATTTNNCSATIFSSAATVSVTPTESASALRAGCWTVTARKFFAPPSGRCFTCAGRGLDCRRAIPPAAAPASSAKPGSPKAHGAAALLPCGTARMTGCAAGGCGWALNPMPEMAPRLATTSAAPLMPTPKMAPSASGACGRGGNSARAGG